MLQQEDTRVTSCDPHDSDYLRGTDWRIGLTELLRVIQFFNTGPLGGLPDEDWSYHRRTADEPATEDGYTPGGGPPDP